MPVLFDDIDNAIIQSLMKDGRKSFRQIAREVKVSTPTVEARFSRMLNTGFIRKIAPVFDADKIEVGITALVFLRVGPSEAIEIGKKLAEIEEVRNVFTSSGDNNMVLRVTVDKPADLETLIRKKIASTHGVKSVSSQLITRVIKDEQNLVVKPGMTMSLSCNFCKGEVPKEPKVLRFGEYERYFCCKSCLRLYKEKYQHRIRALSK